MRKIDDGEKKRKKKKITVEIVATNVVASRPPNSDRLQRRRSCQKKILTYGFPGWIGGVLVDGLLVEIKAKSDQIELCFRLWLSLAKVN